MGESDLGLAGHHGEGVRVKDLNRIDDGRAGDQPRACTGHAALDHLQLRVRIQPEQGAEREHHFGAAVLRAQFLACFDVYRVRRIVLERFALQKYAALGVVDESSPHRDHLLGKTERGENKTRGGNSELVRRCLAE